MNVWNRATFLLADCARRRHPFLGCGRILDCGCILGGGRKMFWPAIDRIGDVRPCRAAFRWVAAACCELVPLLIWLSFCHPAGAVFTNATGMDPTMGGGQVAWGDYNNDGFVDLSVVGVLHRNNGGTSFTRIRSLGSSGIWGDYDNDDWLDFFSYDTGELFHNEGGTSFTAISLPELGIAPVSRGATWSDHDNDGYLDLYVGGHETWGPPTVWHSDVMLRNNQGTGFTNAWTQPANTLYSPGWPRPGRGVTSADFDRDGDIDTYVSNYRLEPNSLYVNDGTGNFSEEGAARGVQGGTGHNAWGHGTGSVWADFDNDGELDLFAGHFAHSFNPHSQFLRNRGAGAGYTFENMGESGVTYQESYGTPVAGDYDNDGDVDLFFTTIRNYSASESSKLFRNNGNWSFTEVTAAEGLPSGMDTWQAGFGDYDNDGHLDLIAGGNIFHNEGNNNHWLKLKMVGDGQTINRNAVGAQVRIQVGSKTYMRQVEFGTGEGNQNDPTLHFGLGNHAGSVDIDILWPGGTTRQVTDLAVDQLHEIHFGMQQYQWAATGGGSWHTASNWLPNNSPNSSYARVLLTGATASTADISVDQPTTVSIIDIDGSADYRLTGQGGLASLDLQQNFEDASGINVMAGDHVFDLPVNVGGNMEIAISSGASLSLDDRFVFHGKTVTKKGDGRLDINDTTNSGFGTLRLEGGILGGGGDINGDLVASAGMIAPGESVGTLDIQGYLTIDSGATLQIEIGGPSSHDQLFVGYDANLSGSLEINLVNGYEPSDGDQFLVMLANSVTDSGLTIEGPNARYFQHAAVGNVLLLTAIDPPTAEWAGGAMGNWSTASSWSAGVVPNSNQVSVKFTGSTVPATNVQLNATVTVRELIADDSSSFQVGGSGTIQLDGQYNQADVLVTGGAHTLGVDVDANANTKFEIAQGATLSLDDTFDFHGVTVTKEGEGALHINSSTNSGSGTLEVIAGELGGSGDVNGDLVASGGVVAPGQGVGTLDVQGDFTLGAAAALQIELGGPASHDLLFVRDHAELSGSIDIELVDGYQPSNGDQFLVMIASSITDLGFTLDSSDTRYFQHAVLGNSLLLTAIEPPTVQWTGGAGGDWNTTSNWSAGVVPNSNLVTAKLTGSSAATTNIELGSTVTVRELVADASSSFQVSGGGKIQLDGQDNQADVVVTGGSHTFNVDVHSHANTTVDIAQGAILSFDDTFDFDGVTVHKKGEGALYLNSNTNSGSGRLEVTEGMLGGSGDVNGDLVTLGGVVAPGQSIGTLDVRGDFTLGAAATLQIELDGSSSSDLLLVGDDADLAGLLDVVLTGGYRPAEGTQFLVMIADSITDSGLALAGVNADNFEFTAVGGTLILTSLLTDLAGDYNKDGVVDAADYTVWADSLGQAGTGLAADGDGNGVIEQADYHVWKTNFGTSLVGASGDAAAVPEPAVSVLLLGMVVAGGLVRQKVFFGALDDC